MFTYVDCLGAVHSQSSAIERELSDFTRVFGNIDLKFLRHVHYSKVPNRNRVLSRIDERRAWKALNALRILFNLQSVRVSIHSSHEDACLSEPLRLWKWFIKGVVSDISESVVFIGFSTDIPAIDRTILACSDHMCWCVVCALVSTRFYWNYAIGVFVSLLVPLVMGGVHLLIDIRWLLIVILVDRACVRLALSLVQLMKANNTIIEATY